MNFQLRGFARLFSAGVLALWLATGFDARAGGPADQVVAGVPADDSATAGRFIVMLRDRVTDARTRLPAIAGRAGRGFTYVREMSGGAHVVRLTQNLHGATTAAAAREVSRLTAQQLMQDPEVAYAEPDRKLYPMLVPNDPLYAQQWNYFEPAGGINLPAAWNITTGSTAIVVAVIDTGIRPHPDFAGRTVPGYDFIADTSVSGDGNGRDNDPSDPGDFGCGYNSSWHGTHVAGTIGAASNNAFGVTGVNWVSKILVARVLGTCGGYTSDIVDAMRWSAGIAVANVPTNANPARVENLSLGGTGACSNTFQSAVTDVIARGTVVVVAAGNEQADASTSEPANCRGVIAVGATTRSGGRASFSNYGSAVAISAPGASILSTLNTGTTTPGADGYAFYSGTSMAAPHVAGVASLMLSQNPALTPAQVTARLRQTARAFPTGTGSDCNTSLCGAGIVDAGAALVAAPVANRFNIAAQANGGVARASTTYSAAYAASGANNGDHRGVNWANGGGWAGTTGNDGYDELQVGFNAWKTIGEIDVFTLQDNVANPAEPTADMTFSQYGLTEFEVQYWSGSNWVTVPGGNVTGNNKVWSKFTFEPVATPTIRVIAHKGVDGTKRIVEVEAYDDAPPVNVARPANGSRATASSTYNGNFPASGAIDGDRRGLNWGAGGGWSGATGNADYDELQVGFNVWKTISEIDVFTLQDNVANPAEPTADMTFSQYGLTDFEVQYWGGSSWVTVPNGYVTGNNKVWSKFTFAPVATPTIRVIAHKGVDGNKRIVEVEAYLAR